MENDRAIICTFEINQAACDVADGWRSIEIGDSVERNVWKYVADNFRTIGNLGKYARKQKYVNVNEIIK